MLYGYGGCELICGFDDWPFNSVATPENSSVSVGDDVFDRSRSRSGGDGLDADEDEPQANRRYDLVGLYGCGKSTLIISTGMRELPMPCPHLRLL
ncbi:hypothetical protein Tco_1267329 [Tanacetum coccineum]